MPVYSIKGGERPEVRIDDEHLIMDIVRFSIVV